MLAFELTCKNGHYESHGPNFKNLHELYDFFINGFEDDDSLGDMRDSLQEVVFMGRNLPSLDGVAVLNEALKNQFPVGKTNDELLSRVKDRFEDVLNCLKLCNQCQDITDGESDLFQGFADQIQHRYGFWTRTATYGNA